MTTRLSRLGVPRSDWDDLRQEVFLVAVRRKPRLDNEAAADAWVAEVCHFVALAHRRKAYRRREVVEPIDSSVFGNVVTANDVASVDFAADQLHAALARLTARERELLALRLAADMPFRSLADLHDCDVKTVRKRFQLAESKLRKHLLRGAVPELAGLAPKELIRVARSTDAPALILAEPEVRVGACDDTLILSWHGSFSERALERFLGFGETLVKERGSQLRCLSVVDQAFSVPRFDERQRILEAIRFLDQYCEALSLVGDDHNYRVLDQILRGLGFLGQARYSFGSFPSVEAGAGWLVSREQSAGAGANEKRRRLVEAVNETRLGEADVQPVSQTLARAGAAAVPGRGQDDVVFHGVTSSVAMASLGNVLVTSWSGPVTQASVNFLIGVADALRRERGPLAHLSIVEAESPTPRFAERQRLLEVARHCKRNLAVFSFVGQMSNIRIAEQIMRGMGFLVRSSLLMCGTKSEAEGVDWIVKHGYSPTLEPARGREILLDLLAKTREQRAPRP